MFNILEDEERTILLVNAQHMRAVPGHKTDVRDSEWLADLLRHGLLHASFIPPAPIRELRELTRYRKTLVQARTADVNRVQKVRESANLKVAAVASDVLGASGRDMLAALIAGEQDPEVLADLAREAARQAAGLAPGPGRTGQAAPPRAARLPADAHRQSGAADRRTSPVWSS